MTNQQIQARIAAMSPDEWRELERKSGIPFSTIKKIGYKQTRAPRGDTIDALAPHVEKMAA